MTDIQRLDDRTVERIAAGEVVERPASVVKELVENAIDADANRVEVVVEAGGTDGIRVTDDGVGMDREAVETAVEKHTTSKIRDIADLEGGVGTLGFRGEALHAIGAVSRLTIRTRPRGGDVGTELVLEGGDVTSVGPAGCPEGTTIAVEDLFYNVPARRKYLKQESTEFAHVNTVVASYALANPDVAVSLTHGDRETFSTTGQGDLRETVMSVYGREVAESMISVGAGSEGNAEGDETDSFPDGPLDGVHGLVSHPETNRAGREYLSTYVNGRYVRAGTVRDAVIDAYGTQIAPDRYPFAVLFLDVPAGDVDVNVHPRKMEVRFADDEGVREQVRTAVEDALLREGLLRSTAPRGRSAPEQTEITPESDEASDSERQPSRPDGRDTTDETAASARTDGTTAESSADTTVQGSDTDPTERPSGSQTETTGHRSTDTTPSDQSVDTKRASPAEAKDDAPGESEARQTRGSVSGGDSAGERTDASAAGQAETERGERKFTGGQEQARLGDEPDATHESLPSMRILGQLADTYVVAETDDGLVLVDQHAADERVNYERLKAKFEGETTTQALATPVELELTAREAEVFDRRSDALASLGFHTARTGERSVEVRTLPGVIADAAGPDIVRDVLGAFVAGDDEAAATVEAAADELLGDLACYPSVTGNTSLTEGSVRELLTALDECENPYACPHGRPTIIHIDRQELEDRFERDYPGHGGRRR
ncbi:DNA mismatch repair endonuclease MutL [Haloarcula argentinensis]|uniref:DNA mismatch repair protein MutL n=1 Tax=Haloarcula argentinensis TaxID=43776 RepID=A0A830FDL1_HALAR|nr:DNA mismatch repair endonuclease MutL [Haloarcula argentinensis]EMA19864.1 DNA mismatch repair protein MutL [Haloarcula argentinensis DSM 12282]MDS0254859.1 DNA mismatch repair endonuclease MutL [Haloarcula argentinensis]GGM38520.1 DNA mismatch repair protein MutL [Haloarcula argentinensis]